MIKRLERVCGNQSWKPCIVSLIVETNYSTLLTIFIIQRGSDDKSLRGKKKMRVGIWKKLMRITIEWMKSNHQGSKVNSYQSKEYLLYTCM